MKKYLTTILAVIICLTSLSGCTNSNPSNASCKLLNDELSSDMLKDSFLQENRTYGAYYGGDVASEDNGIPKSRVFIIKTQDEYDAIFESTATVDIDFGSEMLILYTFTTEYHRDISLDDWKVEDKTIGITYEMKDPSKFAGVGDAAMPFQRFLLIKMNKIDIDSAVITEKK